MHFHIDGAFATCCVATALPTRNLQTGHDQHGIPRAQLLRNREAQRQSSKALVILEVKARRVLGSRSNKQVFNMAAIVRCYYDITNITIIAFISISNLITITNSTLLPIPLLLCIFLLLLVIFLFSPLRCAALPEASSLLFAVVCWLSVRNAGGAKTYISPHIVPPKIKMFCFPDFSTSNQQVQALAP